MMLPLVLLQASCISSVSAFLASPYTSWFPIVTAAALAIFGILAIMYALSPFLGATNMRSWLRTKMFDVFFSIVLIIIFAAFGTMVCGINPVPAFTNADMTAAQCNSTASNPPDSLYGLALCNIYQFNQGIVSLNWEIFKALLGFSLMPTVTADLQFIPGLPGFGLSMAIPSPTIGIVPMLSSALTSLAMGELLNQLQLLIIASSLLIFASFMAIGLIARIFGISRSFGGTMIAFAMGVGFIYPLLVSITYGFMNWQLFTVGTIILTKVLTSLLLLLVPAIGIIIAPVSGVAAIPSVLMYLGIFAIGLLFIPILNFIILDAFIIDFSRAVGEKIDFMSLLVRMV
ncbi:MAG: hypothetical protein QXF41_00625 [Candidatus Micrarchaeaceae archaeon]